MPKSKATIPLAERLEKASDALASAIFSYNPGEGASMFRTPTPITLWNNTPECKTLHLRYYRLVWKLTMSQHLPSWMYDRETGYWLAMGDF